MALSLAAGTAAAQTTPLLVDRIELGPVPNDDMATAVSILFEEPLSQVTGGTTSQFTVTVDGDDATIKRRSSWVAQGLFILVVTLDDMPIPPGAVVVVSYRHPGYPSAPIIGTSGKVTTGFRWKVGVGRVPTVYEALEDYFSGTATLSLVEGVISEVEGKSYYKKLSEEVVSGRLDARFDTDERSVVGTDATSGWHQVGTPSVRPGPDDTCGGTTVPGGEGGFETHVSSRYYWNCTQDGQWVPVKVPQPGVDYTEVGQLQTGTTHPAGDDASQFERDCKANSHMKWDPIRETCIYHNENQYTGSPGG